MKQKTHVIQKYNSIPPPTSEIDLNELENFNPFILEITTRNPFSPFRVFLFILDDIFAVSSNNNLVYEPFISFLREVERFSNGFY